MVKLWRFESRHFNISQFRFPMLAWKRWRPAPSFNSFICRYNKQLSSWESDVELPHLHNDWVRDVAFAPSLGAGSLMFASCSQVRNMPLRIPFDYCPPRLRSPSRGAHSKPLVLQDKKVIIWTQAPRSTEWTHTIIKFSCVLWRVSWSVTGNILAVSGGDNQVTLLTPLSCSLGIPLPDHVCLLLRSSHLVAIGMPGSPA